MSTSSVIGYIRNDGSVRAVSCRFDGYLSNVGKTLIENYDLNGVDDLLDLGNIRSLADTINDTEFYNRDHGEDHSAACEFNSEYEMVDYFTHATFYYIIQDNKWYVSEHCAEFLLLEDRLTSNGIKFTPYVENDDTTQYNARDAVVAMIADGVVDPTHMIKLLLDRIDLTSLEELLKEEFNINDMIPECYFDENR